MPLTRPWTFPPRPLGQIDPFRLAFPAPPIGNPIRPPGVYGTVQIDAAAVVVATNETYSGIVLTPDVQIDAVAVVVITNQTYP